MSDTTWHAALDDLEARTLLAEKQLADLGTVTESDLGPWTEPAVHGPIPLDLVERAQAVLSRQQFLLESIPQALQDNRKQSQLTERITQATKERQPSIYIDQDV